MPEKQNSKHSKKPTRKRAHHLRAENQEPTRIVTLNVHGEPATFDTLNRLLVLDGRIKFVSAECKGPMLIMKTDKGACVVWHNMDEFNSFTKSQGVIAEGARILIPTPPQGEIRFLWEQFVDTVLRITGDTSINLEPPLKEEIQYMLDLAWTAAGTPRANNTQEFIDCVRCVKRVPRNPAIEPGAPIIEYGKQVGTQVIPPVVFIAEDSVWVHVPSFRLWLSIPALMNRQPLLTDVRNGLLLLDFTYEKNVHRGVDGDNEKTGLWRGPLQSLGD